ncbi:TY4B-J, partial [Symbiodinium necroappetens]
DPHGIADLFPSDVFPEEDMDEYEPSVPDEGGAAVSIEGLQPVLESPSELFRDDHGEMPSVSAQAVDGSAGPDGLVAESVEDWGAGELPSDKVELERLVEELKKPVEMVVLRYFVALKSKTGADVAQGVQRMVQHSLPTDKKANGLAERFGLSLQDGQWSHTIGGSMESLPFQHSDGNLVSSKGFRSGVVDPAALEEARVPPIQEESEDWDLFGDEEEQEPHSMPLRRITGKSTVRFVEYDESVDFEALANLATIQEKFDNETFAKIVDHVAKGDRSSLDRRGEFDERIVLGAYCHGGIRGMTRLTRRSPSFTKYVNCFLRSRLQDEEKKDLHQSWTALMIIRATDVPAHKDFRNEWGSLNHVAYVLGITTPEDLTFLFLEDLIEFGIPEQDARMQATWDGFEEEQELELQQAQEEFKCKALSCPAVLDGEDRSQTTGHAFGEHQVEEDMYTQNVEEILEGLTSSLKVVHNVAPAEVKRHLSKWRQAAMTEVNALEGMKGIRRLFGDDAVRESRVSGTQILPAKTVFTVKPGSGKDLYRRKCRVVGCGNFEAKDSATDVYASGIPADVLRACLIEASARKYGAYITDIKNAFLLAPIPESEKTRILLRPPRILELLEITQPGELWYVERAIYGLRHSPRWWSDHRDAVLRDASWQSDHGTVRLVQSSIESNLWTLVTDCNRTIGYAIVYVDDLMILSSPEDAELAHAWIRSTWECTPLQAASKDEPITFLGVEIRVESTDTGAEGFTLSQKGYIEELVRAHELEWVKDLPEEEVFTPESLRFAQR